MKDSGKQKIPGLHGFIAGFFFAIFFATGVFSGVLSRAGETTRDYEEATVPLPVRKPVTGGGDT